MQRAKLIGIAPQLVVKDVVITAAYYRDIYGFNIIGYFMDPPVYAMVERDGFQIHFAKTHIKEIKTNSDFSKSMHDLIIWVPEIDIFYNELKSRKANIVQEIVKRVYGSREFVVKDVDGHTILVGD